MKVAAVLVIATACAAHAPPRPPASPRVVAMQDGDRYIEQHAVARDRIVSIVLPDGVTTETVVVLDPTTRHVLHREYLDSHGDVARFLVDRDGEVLIGYIEPAPPPTTPPEV